MSIAPLMYNKIMNRKRISQILGLAAALALAFVPLTSCTNGDGTKSLSGEVFGTTYNIKFLPHPESPSDSQILDAISKRMTEIDSVMSNWNENSEISRLNRQPIGSPMSISAEFADILEESVRIQQITKTFDISVGHIVNLWEFDDQQVPWEIPSDAQIKYATDRLGLHNLEIDKQGLTATRHHDLNLVLGAIAKGYAVDEISKVFYSMGIQDHLVEIGGEVRASGTRSEDAEGWRVAIERPDEEGREAQEVLLLRNQGIATSGDYREYHEKNGIRYSHIVDPRTGRPVNHRLASVSVLHMSLATADAWATGLFVLGTEVGLELVNKHNIIAYFIERSGDEFVVVESDAFKHQFRK